ncbi:MAG: SLBB domain-containing protein, partial [Comamonas sp.]|nr:SLBB domain-containing protein [Candidatus Comamonas equi]
ISPAFVNAVTLQGNVASPLRYRWFEGMRVRDLIPEAKALITSDYYQRKNALVQNISIVSEIAGQALDARVRNMVDEINWDYAVIERLDPKQLRTQIIPFNLGLAVIHGDESQNLELKEGDVVTVLSQKDLKIPVERQTRLVRVEGEVASPGLYQVKPGETLDQLLMRIGGVTPQAYIFGTAVQRNSVRERQQENLNLLIQRLETQQQSQMLHMLANRSSADMASQAMIMQQQEKLAQNQIAALRKLRSNGRVTLELDPQKASLSTLPELILEDGDHILVPPTPGFISVAGAVNNENVFIYKPGRTVSDVIKVAGLREEADNKQMFVLRADGSIVANNNVGIFGRFSSLELMPGDTVMVPEKLDRETTRNFVVRQLKDMTQILSQFGLGVAAIKVIRDL